MKKVLKIVVGSALAFGIMATPATTVIGNTANPIQVAYDPGDTVGH